MQVWAHPHTGLQTVTWLLDGEIEHRDSLGSQVQGTAGRAQHHDRRSRHRAQRDLPAGQATVAAWGAALGRLPDAMRELDPAFESFTDLPDLRRPGVRGKVLIGEIDGSRSPALGYSPLCGADLRLDAGAEVILAVEEGFEYGVLVVAGAVVVESTTVGVDQLLYLGVNRNNVRLRSEQGGRVIMLGGQPFAEDIVMWWNFIGRSHQEIVDFRSAWERRDREVPACCRPLREGDGGAADANSPAQATSAEEPAGVNPVQALREIGFLLERSRADTYRVRAYRGAADAVDRLSEEQRRDHQEQRTWAKVSGVGPKTATVITQAMGGQVPEYLQKLREEKQPLVEGGLSMRAAIKGDLHCHSSWSDGGSPLEEMMITAQALGHDYCAITDHSPRLQVARGLSAERLRQQMAVVADLNEVMAPFRCLRGIEVDILEDGGLDQDDGLLAELDVVVSSVHSKLRSDSETMTHRMVGGIANPRTNILGHCTGRLIQGERGVRPQSVFDAEVVFEACRTFNVAVEINSRPERRDPPTRLLQMAIQMGCLFSIDTDAHAPGQLEFQIYGCQRAEELGLDPSRVINTWPAEELLAWCMKA